MNPQHDDQYDHEQPVREPIRPPGAAAERRHPSGDDKRVRRRVRRATAAEESSVSEMDRSASLQAIASAPTLAEQARLVAAMDDRLREAERKQQLSRQMEWADAVVGETLGAVPTFQRTSAQSDWLADEPEPEVDHSRIVAQAGLWFSLTSALVRAHDGEFAEQAKGAAWRVAAPLGAQAREAMETFVSYAQFLRRQAASGLDQIQQQTSPDGSHPSSTPLPPEVFPTFAPPVAEVNSGVSGTETSERNPLMQEIMSGGSHLDPGGPEKPGGHSTTDDLSWSPPSGMQADTRPGFDSGMGDTGAPEQPDRHDTAGDPDAEAAGWPGGKKQGASMLPQIQQTIDVHDQKAPTPMPTGVAFPWTMGGPEEGLEGDAEYEQGGTVPSSHQSHATRQVLADQWTQPSQVVQPNVGNSAASTPPRRPGTAAEGRADAGAPDTAPSFADGTATRAYDDAYSAAGAPEREKDVPYMLGGDANQHSHHPNPAAFASRHAVGADEMRHPDFQRGYRYASAWTPTTPVVRPGSPELEAGIWAAMTDNPGQRQAWISRHAALAEQEPALARRITLHRQLTHRTAALHALPTDGTYLHSVAATSTDLDTLAPGTSPSPTGDTPINGPGRPGPLAGESDPAALAGAAPYNGAAPLGHSVVPAGQPAPSDSGVYPTLPDSGMASPRPAMTIPSIPETLAAFRRRVQAGLLASRNNQSSEV